MTKPQPRQKKTAGQRAEETLGAAQRRVDLLTKQTTKLRGQLDLLEAERAEAIGRLDYARKDPALQGDSTTPTPPTKLAAQTGANT